MWNYLHRIYARCLPGREGDVKSMGGFMCGGSDIRLGPTFSFY